MQQEIFIAHVTYADPGEVLPGNAAQGDQCRDGGGAPVHHAVPGEEAGDVEGHVLVHRCDPGRHVFHLVEIIVFSGDYEIRELHVAHFRRHLYGAEHVIPASAADGAVEFRIPGFQVYVPGIYIGEEVFQGLLLNIAIGYHHIYHARLFDEGRRVPDEFEGQGGLVIGPGNADISFSLKGTGQAEDLVRRHFPGFRLLLGDFPVLAEGTAHVAAPAAQGKDTAPGVEKGEGLLLDGVQGGGGHKAVGEDLQLAVVIPPGPAPAPPGRRNPAAVGTEPAEDTAAFFFCIVSTFHGKHLF